MEPGRLLPCPQERATTSYPEPDESSPRLPTRFSKIHFNVIPHLRLGLLSGLFPYDFQTKILYAFLISSTRAIFLTHLTLLGMITVITVGEEYKL